MHHVNLCLIRCRIETLEILRHCYRYVSSRDHAEIHQVTHRIYSPHAHVRETPRKLLDAPTMHLLEDDDAKAFAARAAREVRHLRGLGGLRRLEQDLRLETRGAKEWEH